jgi:hypothetical protein
MGSRSGLGMLGVYNEGYAALKAPLFHGTARARGSIRDGQKGEVNFLRVIPRRGRGGL